MSKDGFDNELVIITYLNWKKYIQLNDNMKAFIRFMFPNIKDSDLILATWKWWTNKADIIITVNNISKNISIKKWTWNSVHQEPVEEFILFLNETYNIDELLANDIRCFIWGDRTLNWKWLKSNRISATQFKKQYPEKVKNISDFFNKIQKDLVYRFVVVGSKSKFSIDYVYHWNIELWLWNSAENIVEEICKPENKTKWAVPVWALTFQAWNRAIWVNSTSEHKRWVIQLKFWGILSFLHNKIR